MPDRSAGQAARYEGCFLQGAFDRVHRAVLDLAASAKSGIEKAAILDIGCGTGRLLRKAGARWPSARLIGVDPDEEMVEIARGLASGAAFHTGLVEALPLPDGSIDVAVSTLSFHHWEGRLAGLREVARVLAPGGCFCLADIVLPPPLSFVIRHFGRQSAADLLRLLGRAGFHVGASRWVLAHLALVIACGKI
jgi:ubiquinone/menaquinone biosynthesis C-methylase UbiE